MPFQDHLAYATLHNLVRYSRGTSPLIVVGEWLATRPESVRTRDKKGGEIRKRPKAREMGGKSRTL